MMKYDMNHPLEILTASKCYFYDTSAFRDHASLSCRELILQYILQTKGIIVITKTVYIELCSANGRLWKEHVQFIEEIKQMGIKLLILEEEKIVELLLSCYSNVAQVNTWLSYAVRCVKGRYSAIEKILSEDSRLRQEILLSFKTQDRLLGKRFFEKMRALKEAEDNLGEELLNVCLHLISNIPERQMYKYIMLTDDKNAVRLLGKVKKNIECFQTQKLLGAHTSANLCWHMKQSGIAITRDKMIQILKGEKEGERLTIYGSEKYSLSPELKSMSCEEVADGILQGEMKVYM